MVLGKIKGKSIFMKRFCEKITHDVGSVALQLVEILWRGLASWATNDGMMTTLDEASERASERYYARAAKRAERRRRRKCCYDRAIFPPLTIREKRHFSLPVSDNAVLHSSETILSISTFARKNNKGLPTQNSLKRETSQKRE